MTKTRVRVTSCLLWVLLSLLSFYHPAPAKAETQPGVSVTVYNDYGYNNAPPLPPQRPVVGMLVQSQVLNNFDYQPLFNMYEDFIVQYTGFITVDADTEIMFYAPADDGVKFYLNDSLIINDWYDKGGGGSVSQSVPFIAGVSQPFTLWFYENGGGAWVQLWWLKDGVWEIIPESAFTLQKVAPPTTTTTTTTSTTTTTVPETTTTVPQTTTTQSVPATTTTESVPMGATTTTEVPVLQTTTSAVPPVVVRPTTTPPLQTTLPPTTTTSTTTVPFVTSTSLQVPSDTSKVSEQQAVLLATNPEVLKQVSTDQASDIFKAVPVSDLSEEQADELVAAVQDAPEEVRAVFENTINIFGGKFNKYVPIGSKINVGQRKVLVAASGVLFVAPTVSVSSSTSGSQSSDSRKRKS